MSPGKRKATEINTHQPLIEIDDDGEHLPTVDQNCDEIRNKISDIIFGGEMEISRFQRAIGASDKSFWDFMGMNGSDAGCGSNVYYNAVAFFAKREQQASTSSDLPQATPSKSHRPISSSSPTKKQKVSKAADPPYNVNGASPPKPLRPIFASPTKKQKVSKTPESPYDVSGITLEGEDTVSVPLYDSCQEIRRKIRLFLRNVCSNQSQFCREIAKTYPNGKQIQSKILTDFLSKKGASAGNTSSAYYASYVFFEKMRIRDKKEKSKHRLEMEEFWSLERMDDVHKEIYGPDYKGGMQTKDRIWGTYTFEGDRPWEDSIGRWQSTL